MKTLIVNDTKKPSAILVDGAHTCAIKAEDLNAKRGTSCTPNDCVRLMSVEVDEFILNNRSECDTGAAHTLENLAQSALKWFAAHLHKANTPNSPRIAMMLDYDLTRTLHVIVTADIATNREGLRIYKTTLSEVLEGTAILEEVLTVRGYESNLELMLHAFGDTAYAFEDRCAFHDRGAMAFDVVKAEDEHAIVVAMQSLVKKTVSDLLNPTLLESGITIDEALKSMQTRADALIDLAGLNDVQGREQMQAWACTTFTSEVVQGLMKHYKMDCVLLAGAPFVNTIANTAILTATPGLFSVAPFDAQLGAMLHQLPDEVLRGNMCICTRDVDSFDNVQGNDRGTALEVLRDARAGGEKGFALVIQGDAGLLDCINGHDLILLDPNNTRGAVFNAMKEVGSPMMRPWRASYKVPASRLRVIGSDEYGLVNDATGSVRLLTLQPTDLLTYISKNEGDLDVLPLKHYRGGAANIMRYGETLIQPNLTIVEHD